MKPLLFTILAATLILFSCGNEATVKPITVHKRDTSLTLAIYLGYALRGYQYGPARKITIDTLTWVGKDSLTMRKEWTKLVYYDVSVQVPVQDSATAKALGLLNWNGKDTVVERLLQADAKYVRDNVSNWDSSVAYLKQFMDTTYNKPKKDTGFVSTSK